MKRVSIMVMAASIALLSGCASVALTDNAAQATAKTFPTPDAGKSGVYVFRSSFAGKALKKDVWIDGECLGETADKVFFYTTVAGDQEHTFSTESEFSPNDLAVRTESGRNYFIEQSIKMGVFVGGAKLAVVPEAQGRSEVGQLKMAQKGNCSK